MLIVGVGEVLSLRSSFGAVLLEVAVLRYFASGETSEASVPLVSPSEEVKPALSWVCGEP